MHRAEKKLAEVSYVSSSYVRAWLAANTAAELICWSTRTIPHCSDLEFLATTKLNFLS